jgi:serine/threonine protein kinase
LEKDRIIEKDDEIRVKREFDMLALFNHPNVILVAEIFESTDSFYSVMEYCEGGELFNYIVKNRRLSDEESAFFFYQLINGLEYIHSLGIVHRDLKPENLLLTNEHLLKIIDFGLSNYFVKDQKELLSTPCGSPCYASPEMVGGKKYNGFKIDIWSSGIILYAMLCGYLPFEDKDNDILFEKILECKLYFPKYISKNAKDLMEKILVTDPDKRISIAEIKNHPFYLKGKDFFEQEFSVYQITKDINNKTSYVENININQILNNKAPSEINKENKDNNISNKENINEENIKTNINVNVIDDKKQNSMIRDKQLKLVETGDVNIEGKKEVNEIVKNENEDKEKEKEKDNDEKKEEQVEQNSKEINNEQKEEKVLELGTKSDKKIGKNILIDEMEKENIIKHINTQNNEQNNLGEFIKPLIPKGNENNKNNLMKAKTLNSKKKLKINSSKKNKDKNITLIANKYNLNNINNPNNVRRKLIKNEHKLNIRIRSRVFGSQKKTNNLINYNNLKKNVLKTKKLEISPNLKKIKNNSKNLIHKRLNNYNIFRNKLNSKDNFNKKKLSIKGNLASININNTIDNLDLSNKTKVYFNFQKLSMNQAKSSKRAHSAAKHNMKMNSFETSKIKNDKKYMDNLLDINNSTKKNQKKVNSHKKPNNVNQKYNLLHKKNLNKININFKNKTNNVLVEENKRRMLKTELIKEKGKNMFESKKVNLTNINIDTIANINNLSNLNNANIIHIIDNTNNDTNEGKSTQKKYSIKTNVKKNKNKISPKKFEFEFKGNNKKYIMRTFDKVKHNRLWKQNLNKYSKMSGNLNMNYNLHKKTLENDDIKKHKINIDISTNIGCTKATSSSKNNKLTEITKRKIERNSKKKGIGNKTDIFDKDININIDLNNKKSIYRDIHISQKNSNLNTIESTLKTDPNQKNLKKSNLNTLENDTKDDNKPVTHMKLISHNTYKAKNHKTGNNHSKKSNPISNLPKHLNKTSTISNVNSSIKNPFLINDSNNYENCNSIINNNTNYTPGTHYLNKKYIHSKTNDLIQNNNKKKPCVTIRNTVINFNMIDSGLILASLNKKKDVKKRNNTIEQNNSVNRINNNHLSGLCSKFNSNNISINNNIISNINHSSINDFNLKTKTIIANSNNNMYINNKKILGYAENINKNYRKIIHINNNKNYINNQDKGHTKYNSMRLEDFYGLKRNKKNIKNFKINTSNLGNTTDNKIINIEQKQLNSFNKGIISERNKNFNSKNKK